MALRSPGDSGTVSGVAQNLLVCQLSVQDCIPQLLNIEDSFPPTIHQTWWQVHLSTKPSHQAYLFAF